VLDAAQLGALAVVDALLVGPEPGLVDDAGDRVDLAAEAGDPPGVDDVTESFTVLPAGTRMRSTATAPFGYSNCQ
jgi:hypothetical protein